MFYICLSHSNDSLFYLQSETEAHCRLKGMIVKNELEMSLLKVK